MPLDYGINKYLDTPTLHTHFTITKLYRIITIFKSRKLRKIKVPASCCSEISGKPLAICREFPTGQRAGLGWTFQRSQTRLAGV